MPASQRRDSGDSVAVSSAAVGGEAVGGEAARVLRLAAVAVLDAVEH